MFEGGYFNLNDLELVGHVRTIHREQARLDELSAQKRSGALIECLSKIEDAARKAGYRVLEITPK